MADTDKKFLDDDGVSQFAEETKNYVDNKFLQLDDVYIRNDDTTVVRLRNQNEINLQEDHNNAWFGYRDGKVTNWKFGDGTEGGLADVYVKDLYLGDEKLSETYIRVDDTTIVKLVNDNEINLQEDHNNAWFGYRGGKVTNWKFGDGTEGDLADVYVKDLYLGDEKLSDLLGAKANDADVVHKSGNETIAGVKTFTSSTVIDGSGKFYQAYASDYIKGVVPSAATYQGIRFYDDQKISTVANHITGAFELQYGTDGYNKAYVGCRNYSGTSQLNYNVGLRVPNDSTRSIDFHPSVDNKINLGTSSYRWADTNTVLINGKTPAYASDLDDLVHKSGNETVNGTKTFTLAPVSSNGATTNGFFIKNTAIARNDVPTNIYHSTFRVNDKNDKILGEYCVEKSNSGSSLLNMNVRTDDSNGNQISKSLYLNLKNDGSDVSFHPSSTDEFNLGTSAWKWKDVNTVLLNGKTPELIEEQGDGYIRYSNGIQICWGFFIDFVTTDKAVTFQKPFLTARDFAVSVAGQSYSNILSINGWTNTEFYVRISATLGENNEFVWQAIGRWK